MAKKADTGKQRQASPGQQDAVDDGAEDRQAIPAQEAAPGDNPGEAAPQQGGTEQGGTGDATAGRNRGLLGALRPHAQGALQWARDELPGAARGVARNPAKMALAVSVLALAVSLLALVRGGGSYIDADNPFVRANAELHEGGVGVNGINLTTAGQGQPAATGNGDSMPDAEATDLRDRVAFKEAVREVMAEIDSDERRAALQRALGKYANAPESSDRLRHIYGNPKARFRLLEFSDVECPYCKNFHDIPRSVADISQGQVAVEWRHFPLPFHDPLATEESLATECVFAQGGNRHFWAALGQLFSSTGSNGQGSPLMDRIPAAFMLDEQEYSRCLGDPATADIITRHRSEGERYGVSSTPSIVVLDTTNNAYQLIPGAVPAETIMQAVERLNAMPTATQVPEAPSQQPQPQGN